MSCVPQQGKRLGSELAKEKKKIRRYRDLPRVRVKRIPSITGDSEHKHIYKRSAVNNSPNRDKTLFSSKYDKLQVEQTHCDLRKCEIIHNLSQSCFE